MTMIRPVIYTLASLLLTLMLSFAANASSESKEAPAIIDYQSIHHPVVAENGMVVSQQYIASRVGRDILRKGGNAVDAAVATSLALAVVLPRAGNLGGGGFMLVHLAEKGETVAIDYREMAPAKAHRNLFLNADGSVNPIKARFSHLSAGVPGTVGHGVSLGAIRNHGVERSYSASD